MWSFVDRVGQQIIHLIITILMARQLTPDDYGLIGLLSIFLAITQSLIDSGFSQSLIRSQNVKNQEYSTIFIFNLVLSISFYLLFYFLAPLISGFYNEPELTKITRFVALSFIFNGLSIIQNTILLKNLDFKVRANISIFSNILSGVLGVIMAYNNLGVWSLVGQVVSNSFFKFFFYWISCSWRPIFVFDLLILKKHFKFGSKLMLSGLIGTFFDNLHALMIGKVYNSYQLGLFNQAKRLQELPVNTLSSTLQSVSFPLLSNVQQDSVKLIQNFKDLLRLVAFFSFPMMAILFFASKELILTLFSVKWIECDAIFKYLCIVGLTYPLSAISLNILKVKGRSDLFLKVEIIKRAILLVNLLITINLSVLDLVIGLAIVSIISFFINIFASSRVIDYPFRMQLKNLVPSFLYTLTALLISYSICSFIPPVSYVIILVTKVIAFCLVFVLICYVFNAKEFYLIRSFLVNKT